MTPTRLSLLALALLASPLHAQRQGKGDSPPRTALPDAHPHQKTLRAHLAKLTEKDFAHGVAAPLADKPFPDAPDGQYRQHLFTLTHQPLVGTKRGTPAITAPAKLFLLSSIETPKGVLAPPVWPETLAAFVRWDHPGNSFRDSRALKHRAFAAACVLMLMLDDQLENAPERGGARPDWMAYQLVVGASPYPTFHDVLPRDVRQAYQTLLRRLGQRVLDWGVVGEEPNFDVIAAVGLWYVAQALDDPKFTKEAEARARQLLADPAHFHPAGYHLDNGGIDVGYQGTSNYFANWAALAGGWPFAKDAVARTYRLRAHLCLPEPDGTYVGPSHFNSRTSSDAWGDQWPWNGARDHAAALVTDEAAYLAPLPTADELKAAPGKRLAAFRGQIAENPVNGKGGFLKDDEIGSHPWTWRMWHSFNFPVSLNPAYDHYPAGAYARLAKLRDERSPMLKSPFLRGETFVRAFDKAFVVARAEGHAAVVHTGPVGSPQGEGKFDFPGPLGFGGGQLSAFWTPTTGSVILGRRGGNTWGKTFDVVDEWRNWPIHAVSGTTHAGKAFTSARIVAPAVDDSELAKAGRVTVSGTFPVDPFRQGKVLQGRVRYQRRFTLEPAGVRVETEVRAQGQDKFAELVETLPVYLYSGPDKAKEATAIEFEVAGKWSAATAEYADKVTAVRLKRHGGAVRVTFDEPRRVKLSPAVWADSYLSRAACRNVVIDLLGGESPVVLRGGRTVAYRVAAEK